jgi:hypothetical protein
MRIAGATGRYAGPRPAPLSSIVSPPGRCGPDGRRAAGGTPIMTDAPCAAAADSPPRPGRRACLDSACGGFEAVYVIRENDGPLHMMKWRP